MLQVVSAAAVNDSFTELELSARWSRSDRREPSVKLFDGFMSPLCETEHPRWTIWNIRVKNWHSCTLLQHPLVRT
jgi:hypothetical protein